MDRLISEKKAIEAINDYWGEMETPTIDGYINAIKSIPSAEPKEGHWEWVQYDSNPNIGNWHCSECRTIIPHMPEETDNTPIYKWCPMCGARMECERKRVKRKGTPREDYEPLYNCEN